MLLAGSLYAVFIAYPFVVRRGARAYRDPYLTADRRPAPFFFVGRADRVRARRVDVDRRRWCRSSKRRSWRCCCAICCSLEAPGGRDLGRLALVAGAALAFVTVAIPLQLKHQWITIGWMLEGAALAWLYRRIPHRGLLCSALALLSVVFARLALNPAVFIYEPRGDACLQLVPLRVSHLRRHDVRGRLVALEDRRSDRATLPRASSLLPAGGVILLFLLLNIEIADFYATGPDDRLPVRRDARAGSDLHDRLADLRAAAAHRRHLPAQSHRPDDRRRADRGHDVQGVPVRHGIARRPVPRRRRSSGWRSRCRWSRSRCRSSCCRRPRCRRQRRRRQRRRREDRPDSPRAPRAGRGRGVGADRRHRPADDVTAGVSIRAADRIRRFGPAPAGRRRAAPGRSQPESQRSSVRRRQRRARSRICWCSSRPPHQCGNRPPFCRSPRPISTS